MEDLIEKKDGELLQKHACDSSDYLIAVACGAVSGLVDIFLVGAPSQSVIGKWTDAQVDEAVKKVDGLHDLEKKATLLVQLVIWKDNIKSTTTRDIQRMWAVHSI
mgnify:CR=1 FL=1